MNNWFETLEEHIGSDKAASTVQFIAFGLMSVAIIAGNWAFLSH